MKKFMILFCFGFIFSTNFAEFNKKLKPKTAMEYSEATVGIYNEVLATASTVTVDYNNKAYLNETNSLYTGYFIEYNQNGMLNSMKYFKNGVLDGAAYYYSEKGSLSKVSNFKTGVKGDEEVEFYENGQPKKYTIYEKNNQSSVYSYNSDGDLTKMETYKNGYKNGDAYVLSDGVIIEKEFFINDKLEGDASSYYSEGQAKSSGKFKNDLRDGKWTWYYPDGEMKLIETYVNGKVSGDIKGYFPDGSVERSLSLLNGEGEFLQYYNNGVLKAKGKFHNYSAYGEWLFYDKNGNIVTTDYF